MRHKKYVKGVTNTTRLLITEQVGYGTAGIISGMDTTGVGASVFKTGSGLAGMPSLMSGAGNVLGSMKMLDYKPRKHRKR
jgi:hypothetical protein